MQTTKSSGHVLKQTACAIMVVTAVVAAGMASEANAVKSFSLRVSGGVANTMYNEVTNERDAVTAIFGAGLGFTFSKGHSLFLDFESLRRTSSAEGLLDPTRAELTYHPFTLGYCYTIPSQVRVSPFVLVGVTEGKSVYDQTGSTFQTLTPVIQDCSLWRTGLVFGSGLSVHMNTVVTISLVGQYRFLFDRMSNYVGGSGLGKRYESPDGPTIGGLEGKLLLEIRL